MSKRAVKPPISPRWDARGVCLTTLAAQWTVEASPSDWKNLISSVPLALDSVQSPSDTFPDASCYVVDGPEKGSRRVGIGVHDGAHGTGRKRSTKTTVEAHWRLDVWTGKRQVKSDIMAKSEGVGGYDGVFKRLAAHWPTKAPMALGVSASYILDPKRYMVHETIRATGPAPVKLGKLSLVPDAVVWKIVADETTSYVTITSPASKREQEMIAWSGTIECPFGDNFLNNVDTLIWNTLLPILVEPKT